LKPLKPASHRLIASFALCLLLLTAACGGQTEPTAAAATPVTGGSLATYTNPTYGYSIDYPATLTLQADHDEFVWLDKQIAILVSSFNPEEARGGGPVIEFVNDTTIGEHSARRLTGYIGAVGGSTPQRYESIVVSRNGSFYVFTVYELKNDVSLPADRELGEIPQAARDLFEQVLGSVRFTN
jgi:hypothetical protein